jgi:hypothetical protein
MMTPAHQALVAHAQRVATTKKKKLKPESFGLKYLAEAWIAAGLELVENQ